MAKTISVSEARDELGDTVDRVARKGQRVRLTRRGKAVAAIVSTDDLALLEALEESGDVEDARAALREGGFIPLEKVKARLGL